MMLAGDKALSDGGWHASPVARALPVSLLKSSQPTFDRTHAKAILASAGYNSPITQLVGDSGDNASQWSELPDRQYLPVSFKRHLALANANAIRRSAPRNFLASVAYFNGSCCTTADSNRY